MTINLSGILQMIQTQADNVSGLLASMQASGKSLSITSMIKLQMAMNKFSQISDLGSTTISLYNRSIQTAIQNVQR